ncbi:MAG: IS3 family transposase [Fusobacterium sp.]|uniref:IS3 family transposase n=1 Tax=Fusobacterium sp. TaxID=68766 RepID=UPI00399ACBA3
MSLLSSFFVTTQLCSYTLKRELIQGSKFETPEQAQKEIFKYIELYYNVKRMHSSLNFLSPIQYEK